MKASGWRRRAAHEPRSGGGPDPHRPVRRLFQLADRPDLEQGIHRQVAGGGRGGPCARGEAGGTGDGAGRAAPGGGGTRGAGGFCGAIAGQGAGR
ncbi:MAG: hypothetical protein DMD73_14610 [Gemmatimonadetes bacterium]|nr:MAG: hypothetical protein DMD73_14610 [Gemmatimonadota bacterium]